ncbi:MAG: ion channel [Desulfatibacillaceae bacterium]
MNQTKHFIILAVIANFLIVVGTGGYMFIEKWSFVGAFYMTVITLSTVGYSEIRT